MRLQPPTERALLMIVITLSALVLGVTLGQHMPASAGAGSGAGSGAPIYYHPAAQTAPTPSAALFLSLLEASR